MTALHDRAQHHDRPDAASRVWPQFRSGAGEREARQAEVATVDARTHGQPGVTGPLRTPRAPEPDHDRLPDAVRVAIRAGGSPLAPATRDEMQERLGFDFGRVRIHGGPEADTATASMKATALSIGSHVLVGDASTRLRGAAGARLLAHELWHTTQDEGHASIGRQSVQGIETDAVLADRPAIEMVVAIRYWDQKVRTRFQLNTGTAAPRFKVDPEEEDAVLSVLWARSPAAPITKESDVIVSIPARSATTGSHALLYHFTYKPPAAAGQQEQVVIDLVATDATATVTAAPAAPAAFVPPRLSKGTSGFPVTSDDYFKAHPEEHRQLYNWILSVAGSKFDQVVTTTESPPGGKRHDSTFGLKGAKSAAGAVTTLEIALIGETPTFVDTPAADYRAKTGADLELEKAQGKAADKLGQVRGLASLPPAEQPSVKYMVFQYFNAGTRNREVDVVVPIAKATTRVFYTLRFRPTTNDVDVERVGEADSTAKLTSTGMDISRVEGFAANSADPATLKAWLAKRYPAAKPAGTTVADLQASATKELDANAGTPAWFSTNYGMPVLDAVAAEARLISAHKLSRGELAGLKAFTTEDLRLLEFALQTMSDAELQLLKGTQLTRQEALIEVVKGTLTPSTDAGIARHTGSERTITFFDTVRLHEQRLFVGGSGGVRPISTMTFVHELGHIIGLQNNIESAFAAFVKRKGIRPVTRYATSKPVTESFPEAFALYQLDPEWMKTNIVDLYNWFETVKRSGKP